MEASNRVLVTLVGFVLVLILFRTTSDMGWFSELFFGIFAGLIIGTAFTKSGHEAARRITVNMRTSWTS